MTKQVVFHPGGIYRAVFESKRAKNHTAAEDEEMFVLCTKPMYASYARPRDNLKMLEQMALINIDTGGLWSHINTDTGAPTGGFDDITYTEVIHD